jgi:hypothetical protein
LAALHGYFARSVRMFATDSNRRSARFFRILNEFPTVDSLGPASEELPELALASPAILTMAGPLSSPEGSRHSWAAAAERVRSKTRLSERDEGVEHFRVRTIGFPNQGVWIMPQIDRAGCAVTAARAIFPDLIEHFVEIPADRIDVQS